ncbi:glycosyltransferase family 9 protein [Streptomyces sp. 4N509B]|uniref:glycosyltransferase family 9 protein n=1 Tax=Streptomyces sp. 4N509B TaxID=3457413 RepID=UPI003FCF8B1B
MTVLVLRALGLGDLLTAVPALRALRRATPGRRLLLAAPPWLAPAVAMTRTVDGLLPAAAPGRAVPRRIPWTGEPPEWAVDMHGRDAVSLSPLRKLGPRRLSSYALGPRWRPEEHERLRWCRLLAWYGVPADPDDLHLTPPALPSPAPGAVVLHPGADAGARRWPAERFAAVGRALRRLGWPVVVTADAVEAPLARRVAALAGLPPDAALTGLPLPRLAALVAGAQAVVVGDTGVSHLATALGTPSVTLFGPVSPARWGPPDVPRHRVLWHPGNDGAPHGGGPDGGDPHGDSPDARLLRITHDEVLTALATVL